MLAETLHTPSGDGMPHTDQEKAEPGKAFPKLDLRFGIESQQRNLM